MSALTTLIRRAVWSKTLFEFWQKLGVNVTRKHFSSPIPDTRELAERQSLWTEELPLAGVDMNPAGQLRLLEKVFPKYRDELDFAVNKADNPNGYYVNNAGFGFQDAAVLHCMIRHFRPKTVIEVGAGFSTFISARAALMNEKEGHPTRLVAVEPYPIPLLKKGFPGLDNLLVRKAEEMEVSFFEQLGENDILFIDTSHVVRIGNDVNFLYLDVLPTLKKGVVVHTHDIFFPHHHSREQVLDNLAFWTEQYLLQAFLCLNSAYEVLFGNHYMLYKYPDRTRAVFAAPPGCRPRNANSFWIRRTK